jgi:hypothetical protein
MRTTIPARRDDPGPPPDSGVVEALMRRVEAGESDALQKLSRLTMSHPRIVAEETGSDLAWLARTTLANRVLPGVEGDAYRVRLEARMDLFLHELAGRDPSPAMRLVSEAVVFAWAEHWTHSTLAARLGIQQMTPMQVKRQQAALRCFMASLKTYAQIARLEGRYGTSLGPSV